MRQPILRTIHSFVEACCVRVSQGSSVARHPAAAPRRARARIAHGRRRREYGAARRTVCLSPAHRARTPQEKKSGSHWTLCWREMDCTSVPVKDQLVETVLFDFPAEARKRTIGGRRSQPRDLGGDLGRDHNLRDDNDRFGWGRRQAQNGGSPDGGPMVSNPAPSSGESETNSVIGSTHGPVTSLRIARAHLSADTARCPEAAEHAYLKDLVSSYGKTFHMANQARQFPLRDPAADDGFYAR